MQETETRTWQEDAEIHRVLYEAKSAQEYASVLPKLTDEELQEELTSVRSSLATIRQCVQNNESNGFGGTENTKKMCQSVETGEQKIALLQTKQAGRKASQELEGNTPPTERI